MPSSVIGWTTAAIFYFVHNVFFLFVRLVVTCRLCPTSFRIDVDLAHKWTPLHPQPLPYERRCAHRFVSVEHERRMEKWFRYVCVSARTLCETSTCVRLRSHTIAHWHAHIDTASLYSIQMVGVCVWVRDSLSAKREKIIRYGIGLLRLSDCKYVWMQCEQCPNWSETNRMSTTALPLDKWMIDEFFVRPQYVCERFFIIFFFCDLVCI